MDSGPIEIVGRFDQAGANQSVMRDRNERLVLSILRQQGAVPKAEIARRTGLSAQTVSVIMRSLEEDGLIIKGKKLRGRVGQPSVPMSLAPDGAYFIGLKVGRRSVELILVDFLGAELAHVSRAYSFPSPDAVLDFVRVAVDEVQQKLLPSQRERIAGFGIALPFFLWEWASTIGVDPEDMASWKERDLRAEIAAMYDFPVYLGNDATCACGAELVFGDAGAPADFLYVYLGYFIGGGVVLNGSLYGGRTGNAGAVGPFPVNDRSGAQRQLVDVASLDGLERRMIEATGTATQMLASSDDWTLPLEIVEGWLAEAAPAIAQMIAGASSIIDFPAVLIDGNMPPCLRARVLNAVADALHDLEMPGITPPDLLMGTVGPRARALGAASLPLSAKFLLEL